MHLQALIALATASIAAAASGFASTCINPNVYQSGASVVLQSTGCGDGHGGYTSSHIDLNNGCINNHNGNLYAGGGGFGQSCNGVSLSGTVLSANCGNGKGGTNRASIDLNKLVGNRNGQLVC